MIHHGELLWEMMGGGEGACVGQILSEIRENKPHRSVLFVCRALRGSAVVSLGRDLFIQCQGSPSRNDLVLSANNAGIFARGKH